MLITLTFAEAVALASLETPLPSLVESLDCDDDTIIARIDLRMVPTESSMLRLALSAAGTIEASARFTDFADGIAVFTVTAVTRGLPAHKLLRALLGFSGSDETGHAITVAGLPEGMVRVGGGDGDPEIRIDLRGAIHRTMPGMTATAMRLEEGILHLEATIG